MIATELPPELTFRGHGARYVAPVPSGATLPAFLTIEGLDEPPPGDLVLALRRRPSLRDLFRRAPVFQATVTVRPV